MPRVAQLWLCDNRFYTSLLCVDGVAQYTNAADFDFNLVVGHNRADAFWCAGEQHIAGLERHDGADGNQQMRKNHGR